MTALDRIQVKGFKSIRELDLELRPLNVLIGANGAGKSNLIQVFETLNYIVVGRLRVYVGQKGGADNLLYFGSKTTESIRLQLHFGINQYIAVLVRSDDDYLFFSIEEVKTDPPNLRAEGNSESFLSKLDGIQDLRVNVAEMIEALTSIVVYQFHDTSDTAKIKQTQDIDDNRILHSDGRNLAPVLYYLKQKEPAYYNQIVQTIQMVAPFFDDFALEPSRLNPDKIRLQWREKNSPPDTYFDASMLSDGTLRFMSLATLLLQPDLPSTILIDEPELGLHPFAITTLVGLLRSAASKTQVIVATQSVPVVNQLDPEDIIIVDRVDGQSTFKRPDPDEIDNWLETYGLGDLWEKNIIGGRPQR